MRDRPFISGETLDGAENVSEEAYAKRVGDRLKALREMLKDSKLPYTQQYMQERVDVNQSNWSKYENGKTLLPADTARKISAIFRLKMGFLYDGNPAGIHPKAEAWFRQHRPHLLGEATTDTAPDTDTDLADYRAHILRQVAPPVKKQRKR